MSDQTSNTAPDFSIRGDLVRRDFLRDSLGAFVMVSTGGLVAACGPSDPVAGYAIAPEVFTTLEKSLVRGPKPAPAAHLYEVAQFGPDGCGSRSLGASLAADRRTDLMPAGYDASSVSQTTKLLRFFTISDIHITDKEAPNQLMYLGTRVESLSPFSASLYSPVMLCSTQVLDAPIQTVSALRAKSPMDFGLSLGDCCNSAQYNALRWSIDVLDGQVISPNSGAHLGADRIDYRKPYQAAGNPVVQRFPAVVPHL